MSALIEVAGVVFACLMIVLAVDLVVRWGGNAWIYAVAEQRAFNDSPDPSRIGARATYQVWTGVGFASASVFYLVETVNMVDAPVIGVVAPWLLGVGVFLIFGLAPWMWLFMRPRFAVPPRYRSFAGNLRRSPSV